MQDVIGFKLKDLGVQLRRVPTSCVPSALRDMQSEEVLCVSSASPLDQCVLKSLRWATHKRYSKDVKTVQRQLICDLNNGDESRVKRSGRRMSRRSKTL